MINRASPGWRTHVCLLVCAALALASRDAIGQASDTVAARTLTPGVTYRHVLDPRGPWSMHVVWVDLRRRDLELRHVRALDSLRGRERTSAMAAHAAARDAIVLAGVNADFFDLATGEGENNQVLAGEWWKGEKVADSPYDTFDTPHAQFGITAKKRPVLDRFILDATAWVRGIATPILTLNLRPTATLEGTVLYTPRFGASTPRDTTRATAEAPMTMVGRRGDTLLYVRRGSVTATSGTAIPRHGAVLSAYGARAAAVRAMLDGDTVRMLLATRPRLPAPMLLVGGWPRILENGRSVASDAATVEGTISRNAEMRHPRTAIGFSRDSNTVVLLTVDGRTESSGGMTLDELAVTMRRLGAWQALNFDGGGSTTMVVGGAVVNVPSDSTRERAVGSALLVLRHPSATAPAGTVGDVEHNAACSSRGPTARRGARRACTSRHGK